jgi:hypothetical protein
MFYGRQNSTLHRTLKALPRARLDSLAQSFGIDAMQRKLDVERALLAQPHEVVERKALLHLRLAMEEERAA